ncbi:hypothetical protein ABUE29_02685 [Mesorhizobium sp. ZMM04-4]
MENEDAIRELSEFKDLLKKWDGRDGRVSRADRLTLKEREEVRAEIMQRKSSVENIVSQAGRARTVTITPPPIVGGLILRDRDPFDMLLNAPYGMDMISVVIDMIDESIGAIKGGALTRTPRNEPAVKLEIEKSYAFIAMAIDPSDKAAVDVLDTIKDAAAKRGIKAERVDEQHANTRITDRILSSIRRAEFVICDLTGNRPNVFYEAGYAHGLGKLPIYVARKDTDIQFDIHDYPVIFYENMRELRDGLTARLEGLAAKG